MGLQLATNKITSSSSFLFVLTKSGPYVHRILPFVKHSESKDA